MKKPVIFENILANGKSETNNLQEVMSRCAWVARNPNGGGTYVVDWYDDAAVFRNYQESPQGSNRVYKGQPLGYYATTVKENCLLLPVERRIFPVPTGNAGIGRANLWYPNAEFEQRLMQLIKNYEP
jgi:hypothetical protein